MVEQWGFYHPRSAVTRPRRPGEDNVEYEFETIQGWKRREANGEFVEKTEYRGHLYAMLRESFEQHEKLVAVLDRNGLQQIRDAFPGRVTSILLLPPNVASLKGRLVARGAKHKEIQERLANVYTEMTPSDMFDEIMVNKRIGLVIAEIAVLPGFNTTKHAG